MVTILNILIGNASIRFMVQLLFHMGMIEVLKGERVCLKELGWGRNA